MAGYAETAVPDIRDTVAEHVLDAPDHLLAYVGLVTVLPVTRTRLGYPSHLEVESADSGLQETSYVQTEQVRTISIERTVRVIGHLPLTTMNAINGLLRTNLALT